jgi:hypothetical protein
MGRVEYRVDTPELDSRRALSVRQGDLRFAARDAALSEALGADVAGRLLDPAGDTHAALRAYADHLAGLIDEGTAAGRDVTDLLRQRQAVDDALAVREQVRELERIVGDLHTRETQPAEQHVRDQAERLVAEIREAAESGRDVDLDAAKQTYDQLQRHLADPPEHERRTAEELLRSQGLSEEAIRDGLRAQEEARKGIVAESLDTLRNEIDRQESRAALEQLMDPELVAAHASTPDSATVRRGIDAVGAEVGPVADPAEELRKVHEDIRALANQDSPDSASRLAELESRRRDLEILVAGQDLDRIEAELRTLAENREPLPDIDGRGTDIDTFVLALNRRLGPDLPQPSGGMRPEQRDDVVRELKKLKFPPQMVEEIATGLEAGKYGRDAAEIIASGILNSAQNYRSTVSKYANIQKRLTDEPDAFVNLRLGKLLLEAGYRIDEITFERKRGDHNSSHDVADTGLRQPSDDSVRLAIQAKDATTPSAVRRAADQTRKGVGEEGVLAKIGLIEAHFSRHDMKNKDLKFIQRLADDNDITYLMRFEDGQILIRPQTRTVFTGDYAERTLEATQKRLAIAQLLTERHAYHLEQERRTLVTAVGGDETRLPAAVQDRIRAIDSSIGRHQIQVGDYAVRKIESQLQGIRHRARADIARDYRTPYIDAFGEQYQELQMRHIGQQLQNLNAEFNQSRTSGGYDTSETKIRMDKLLAERRMIEDQRDGLTETRSFKVFLELDRVQQNRELSDLLTRSTNLTDRADRLFGPDEPVRAFSKDPRSIPGRVVGNTRPETESWRSTDVARTIGQRISDEIRDATEASTRIDLTQMREASQALRDAARQERDRQIALLQDEIRSRGHDPEKFAEALGIVGEEMHERLESEFRVPVIDEVVRGAEDRARNDPRNAAIVDEQARQLLDSVRKINGEEPGNQRKELL